MRAIAQGQDVGPTTGGATGLRADLRRRRHSFVSPLLTRRGHLRPRAGSRSELVTHTRPIVQRRRIEIGPIGPNKSPSLVVKDNRIEHREILKRREQRTMEDWPKVDALLGAIGERHRDRVVANDLETRDPINGMGHGFPEWLNLDGRLPGLQELPVALQFPAVNLGPCFDEP
jgi:hypothetical protein